MATRKRTSALVVLGVHAGVVSALITLPVTLPLLVRLVSAEVHAEDAKTWSRTATLGSSLAAGVTPKEMPVRLRAVDAAGNLHTSHGPPMPLGVERLLCESTQPAVQVVTDGKSYHGSCWKGDGLRVTALWPHDRSSYFAIGALVVVLAMVAGLVNALGVTQVIRPLTRISAALDQVSMGRRKVVMRPTGLGEIDHLIERLNATAMAVESRENEILSRVQVIQEMARLVAHEVRNPLQSLTLFTQLMVDADDRDERLELRDSIQNEITVLDDVVQRLLSDGSRRGALRLHLERVNVADLLEGLRRIRSQEALAAGIELVVDVEPELEADLDRILFIRSLQNLVSNAMRIVPSTGGQLRVAASLEGEQLLVTVDDNGPGVDPALGERVFEVNVTGGAGTGLGLSLTRGVAEAHGGTVRFTTSDLGGARFEIRVPRHAAAHVPQ